MVEWSYWNWVAPLGQSTLTGGTVTLCAYIEGRLGAFLYNGLFHPLHGQYVLSENKIVCLQSDLNMEPSDHNASQQQLFSSLL
jgi:hypothetical protein